MSMIDFSDWQIEQSPNDVESTVTNQKLKEMLKYSFDQSEALTGIKAHLRKQLLKKLVGSRNNEFQQNIGADNDKLSMQQRALQSAVFHYLKSNNFLNSLSVFSAEVGLENPQTAFSELDIARMFKFASLSQSFLTKLKKIDENKFTSSRVIAVMQQPNELPPPPPSLLDHIFEYCLALRAEQVKDGEVQVSITSPSTREVLEHDLQRVQSEFIRQEALTLNNSSLEERMVSYQQELENRKNKEVDLQVAYFKEQEIQRIRLEESAKSRQALEALRRELEFDYQQRLQTHVERETQLQRHLSEQERRTQQTLYDHRQMMQRDMDDIRSREQATARRYELEAQGLKLLELRLKEAQQVLESRERECERLEREATMKMSKSLDIARKETVDRLAVEQEGFFSEKRKLTADKLKFDEDRLTLLAEVDAARSLRQDLARVHEDLAAREGELMAVKRQLSRFLGGRVTVDGDDTMTNLSHHNTPRHSDREREKEMQQLLHRNRELEAKAALQEDAQKVLNLLEVKNQELDSAQLELARTQVDKELLTNELASARQELHSEKSKAIAREHKLSELQQLVKEKTKTIESLMKQLETIDKKDKFVSSSNALSSARQPPPVYPLPSYYPSSWAQQQQPPPQHGHDMYPPNVGQQYHQGPFEGYGYPSPHYHTYGSQMTNMQQQSQPQFNGWTSTVPQQQQSQIIQPPPAVVQVAPLASTPLQQAQLLTIPHRAVEPVHAPAVTPHQPSQSHPIAHRADHSHVAESTPVLAPAPERNNPILQAPAAYDSQRQQAEEEMLLRLEGEKASRLKAEQELQSQHDRDNLSRKEAEDVMKRQLAAQAANEAEAERKLQEYIKANYEAQAKAERDLQQRLQLEAESKAKQERELQQRQEVDVAQRAAFEKLIWEEEQREEAARLKAEKELEDRQQRERTEQAHREQAEHERRLRLAAQRKAEEEKERQLQLQLDAEQQERDRLLKDKEAAEEKQRQDATIAAKQAADAEAAERKRKEDEDADSISKARALVLARRREKSGSSINMSASVDASGDFSAAAAPAPVVATRAVVQKPKIATRPSYDFLAVDSDSSTEKGLEVGEQQDEQDEHSF